MTGTVQEVGPGCFAWLRLPGGWGETNIGLIVGDGASLLIDTPWDPVLAASMLDAFAPQTASAPIAIVFNTHPDVDHWWANTAVPAAEIVASATTAAAMRSEAGPQELMRLRGLSSLSGRMPGRPGRMGRYVATMLEPFAFDQVQLRYPDRTFTGRREQTVGGRDIVFIDHGSAHTASDCVVFVPDARVVFCGDLLFAHATPIMWHGPVTGWLAALEALMALDADTFVSGHGRLGTRDELQALHDYWSWLHNAVTTHRAAGRGVGEMVKRLTRAPEFAAFRDWENPERLYINVATIDRQLGGKGPIGTDPVSRARAFDHVAALAHDLRR